ncbi:trimethylamine methyltransferase family protein [Albidovulum sediminicola]|uniref:Trimethylamine methyltransferase family protein n=1 Tax=Albidovulum sediminicola TaxID=2984331 RepID=A0ABT2Z4V5_9RHOB|nr:trimethylamine methyltransferase family protein [Defluviimonas sp. WL0075]MCV2866111.1 trimethylamine methyltransferase family protein [Defluviimonas sp. WL0075]
MDARTSSRKRTRTARTRDAADAFRQEPPEFSRVMFGFLSDSEVEWLKERVEDVLADYGVAILHPDAYERLLAAGAKPGTDANRIRMPRDLIQEAMAATPKSVRLGGKEAGFNIDLPRADRGFIMRTGTGAHGYVNPRDASYRKMDLAAVSEIAAVASALDEVGFIAHPFVHGVPEVTSDIHSFGRLIARTPKHIWMQPYQWENVDYLMRIAAVAAGGEAQLRANPITSCITCSFTPLEFKYMDTHVIMKAGEYGIPLHACSLPSSGGTAPLSVPSMAIMAAAEIVGMTVMAHILAPGTPVIATPLMFTLDMRTGSALQSCVESLQAASMSIQLMKRGWGVIAHTYGSGSDTPDVDHQSMAERALLTQTVALAGADILGGVGQLECATVFSPVQAVLDNEVGAMMRRFIRKPSLDKEALNWDELMQIRTGGHFLDSAHTIATCRDQLSPKVFKRIGRDDYEKSGRRAAFDEAREFALAAIAAAPEQGLLSAEQEREIAALTARADEHIVAAYSGVVSVI